MVAEGTPCKGGETHIFWNVIGPGGPQGPIGLTERSPVGTEVAHGEFPVQFAKTQKKAEQLAAAYFKMWAKLQTTAL